MEPKASTNSPEHAPNSPEYAPPPLGGEQLPAYQPERREQSSEQAHERAPTEPLTAMPTPVQLPTPVIAPTPTDNQASSVAGDDNPAVAADEDLIEKEWVDKAKKIIADTREDPHLREREVGKLQADYLRKRYGKELGNS